MSSASTPGGWTEVSRAVKRRRLGPEGPGRFAGLLCTTDAPQALAGKGPEGSALVRLTGPLTCGFVRLGWSAPLPAQT